MGYCRLCLEQENHLFQIDSKGKEIIKNLFDIVINPQDNLSQEICRKCEEELNNWKRFKIKTIKNQHLLKQVANPERKEVNNSDQKTQKKDEYVSKSTTKRKQLDGTDRKNQSDIVVVQVSEEASAKDISVQVPVGDIANESNSRKKLRPKNASTVTSHESRSYSNKNTSGIQSAEVGTSIAINPNPKTSTSTGVKKTSRIATNYKIIPLDDSVIDITNEEVMSLNNPLNHVSIKTELKTPDHRCTLCNKSFGFVESLQNHQRRHHHSNTWKCPECPKMFALHKSLCRHVREHLGLKRPQMMCGICFHVCNSHKELALHRRSTHQNANLNKKKFVSSTRLKGRKRISALRKKKLKCTAPKFICPKNCGNGFKDPSTLKMHSKKCSRLTTSKYEFRQKKVKTKTNLRIHLTRCTGPAALRDTQTTVDRRELHCYDPSSGGQSASNASKSRTNSMEGIELPEHWKIAHDDDGVVYLKTRKAQRCAPTEASCTDEDTRDERSTGKDDNSSGIEKDGGDGEAEVEEKLDPETKENLAARLIVFQDSVYEEYSPTLKNNDRLEEFDKQKLSNPKENAATPEKSRESIDNEEQIKKEIKLTNSSGSSSRKGSNDYVDNNSSKLVTTPADTSCVTESEIKLAFKMSLGKFVVSCLNPYFRINCAQARITNETDFRYLARKLTHSIMDNELKHYQSVADLTCNSNVTRKAERYIRMYMSKFGEIYAKPPDDANY